MRDRDNKKPELGRRSWTEYIDCIIHIINNIMYLNLKGNTLYKRIILLCIDGAARFYLNVILHYKQDLILWYLVCVMHNWKILHLFSSPIEMHFGCVSRETYHTGACFVNPAPHAAFSTATFLFGYIFCRKRLFFKLYF